MEKKKALDSIGMSDIQFESFKGVMISLAGLSVSEAGGVLYLAKKAIHLESKINDQFIDDRIIGFIKSGQLR